VIKSFFKFAEKWGGATFCVVFLDKRTCRRPGPRRHFLFSPLFDVAHFITFTVFLFTNIYIFSPGATRRPCEGPEFRSFEKQQKLSQEGSRALDSFLSDLDNFFVPLILHNFPGLNDKYSSCPALFFSLGNMRMNFSVFFHVQFLISENKNLI
jgi:hypothetical protein